jgi:hypothetical protein
MKMCNLKRHTAKRRSQIMGTRLVLKNIKKNI